MEKAEEQKLPKEPISSTSPLEELMEEITTSRKPSISCAVTMLSANDEKFRCIAHNVSTTFQPSSANPGTKMAPHHILLFHRYSTQTSI